MTPVHSPPFPHRRLPCSSPDNNTKIPFMLQKPKGCGEHNRITPQTADPEKPPTPKAQLPPFLIRIPKFKPSISQPQQAPTHPPTKVYSILHSLPPPLLPLRRQNHRLKSPVIPHPRPPEPLLLPPPGQPLPEPPQTTHRVENGADLVGELPGVEEVAMILRDL